MELSVENIKVKKIKNLNSEEKLLTEVELELMTILWSLGEGTVAEVMVHLSPERNLAYTSVSTMLRILEQKAVVQARKEGRGHIYVPVLKKSDYEAKAVKHVVNRVFQGAPSALVRQLLESVSLSASEIQELKEIIDRASEKK